MKHVQTRTAEHEPRPFASLTRKEFGREECRAHENVANPLDDAWDVEHAVALNAAPDLGVRVCMHVCVLGCGGGEKKRCRERKEDHL